MAKNVSRRHRSAIKSSIALCAFFICFLPSLFISECPANKDIKCTDTMIHAHHLCTALTACFGHLTSMCALCFHIYSTITAADLKTTAIKNGKHSRSSYVAAWFHGFISVHVIFAGTLVTALSFIVTLMLFVMAQTKLPLWIIMYCVFGITLFGFCLFGLYLVGGSYSISRLKPNKKEEVANV